MSEAGDESLLKTRLGLPNRRILNWSYQQDFGESRLIRVPLATGRAREHLAVELPSPCMYEWEAHGLLEAAHVADITMNDFTVIGAVVDSLGGLYADELSRDAKKLALKRFLRRVYDDDGLFFSG